ncbi:MAG TPA: glycoside hydrolase 43 family protein [Tepidisphaeraceae bacterium]|nr:glycoside hydrolase 43 family protein [Tepidisphaeraceae bacterium]
MPYFPLIATCAAVLISLSAAATAVADVGNIGPWGDQGDGTYKNPILPADYSDIDAIRVGDEYFVISSTFAYSPGQIILRSKDLVNWTMAGRAIPDITRISPEMNYDRMGRYGRGVWAGAIRHHDGKFWIYFGDPDVGYFMTTAKDVAGPWEPLHPVLLAKGWDDCCPFWDDDGQAYFIGTHFADKYKIHLFKMSPDGKTLDMASDRVMYSSKGSEANKLYKINGLYYHYFSEVTSEGRVPMMRRAKSLDGPWEMRQIGHVRRRVDKEPNQGGIVQGPKGDWWFVTHQGTGDWEGRAMCLLPVTWTDGWPILGKPGDDGIGNMVWSAKKPIDGLPPALPQTSDTFDGGGDGLAVQWEWNHQPRKEKWSLTERPGFLRLHAFKPLKKGNLLTAGNTLTQRGWRAANCEVTVKLDVSGMADGQHAGFAHYARTWATIGVLQEAGARKIVRIENGKVEEGPAVKLADVWVRSTWGQDGISRFAYSLDGQTFTPLGGTYQLTWGRYRGNRLGIFSYNDESEAGYVDVDSFQLTFDRPAAFAKTPATRPTE